MQVLNGADGVTEMLTSVIGQGLAGLSTIKQILGQMQQAAPQPASTQAAAQAAARTSSHAESN